MNMVDGVRKHVLERYHEREDSEGMDMYDTHIQYVVEYAKELAKKLNADMEIVEMAALLHDIARIDGSGENHHIDGAEYAERFLRGNNYDEEKIKQVKHCILAHRGSVSIPRETIEAECVASADAMAHFKDIPGMFYWVYADLGLSIEEGKEVLKGKFERDYMKMVPEAQDIMKEKYEVIKKILN